MATIGAISAALKLIDVKKDNLRKAFEDLQAQSSSLSSFTLTWSDLDSYFTSLQSSLEHKFKLLQSLKPKPQPSKQPSSSATIKLSETVPLPARPELKSFCEKMDGLGLRRYIIDQRLNREAIKAELPDALRCTPDAAAMVLDAMEGFYPIAQGGKGRKAMELSTLRSTCIILLEELMGVKPVIADELREKAMKLAVDWKGKITSLIEGDKPLGALGFLFLVATYGLVYGFGMDELIDFVLIVAKRRQATDLVRAIISADRISDLIQKLISDGKHILAVRFSFEFEKTDKFPPVPLLKEYRKESKKLAKKVRKDGNNSLRFHNEATAKELSALRSIIKCIEDYDLDSEYPKHALVHLAERLEKETASKKRPVPAPAPKRQQLSRPRKPNTIKRPRTAALAGPATTPNSNSNVLPLQQSHLHTAGLLPDRPAQYQSSPAVPYGMAGATHALPYTGSTSSPYVLTGAPLGFTSNPTPTGSNLCPPELYAPSGYYDGQIAYGGYGLPPQQYHPSYYAQ